MTEVHNDNSQQVSHVYRWRRCSWDTIVDRTSTWMDSSSHILLETTNCYTMSPMLQDSDSLHRTQRTLNSRVKLKTISHFATS